jgi:hypothetical protein
VLIVRTGLSWAGESVLIVRTGLDEDNAVLGENHIMLCIGLQ